ncbi:MAG: DUF1566 domain-containing protein [Desulfuromonas sp.]|nr:DUF1566 domain-containing protein [Desulfuromonas sp.]
MKQGSPLVLLSMARTIAQSRDFIVHNWTSVRLLKRAEARVDLRGGTKTHVLTGLASITALSVLLLGLSGCGERREVKSALEWECCASVMSSFLQTQELCKYSEAQAYCESLTLDDKDDWRLPSRHELMSSPLQVQEMQQETHSLHSRETTCWSSTPYHDSRLRYWAVSVSNNQAAPLEKDTRNAVICVRNIVK